MDPRVERVFREVLDDRRLSLTPESAPGNVAGWDSFAHVKLILALEEEFGVSFTVDDVAEAANLGDLIQVLKQRGADVE